MTGGASGIGRAVVECFASTGAQVVVADRPSCGGEDIVGSLRSAGHDALFVPTDVTDIAQTELMVRTALDPFGVRVGVLTWVGKSQERWQGRRVSSKPLHQVGRSATTLRQAVFGASNTTGISRSVFSWYSP